MREKNCSTKSFRQLANEIGMLIGYEVMRDLPTEAVEIETPIAKMLAPKLAGKKLVFAPILRAGEVVESDIWVKQIVHPDGAPCRTHSAGR